MHILDFNHHIYHTHIYDFVSENHKNSYIIIKRNVHVSKLITFLKVEIKALPGVVEYFLQTFSLWVYFHYLRGYEPRRFQAPIPFLTKTLLALRLLQGNQESWRQ